MLSQAQDPRRGSMKTLFELGRLMQMKTKIIYLTLIILMALTKTNLAQEIPLSITTYLGNGHSEKWIENGVPIPQSRNIDPSQLSLWQNGQQVEADFHPLAYWADGSIRWAKVSFVTNDQTGYSVQTDVVNTTQSDLFTAVKSGTVWTISTGAIRFTMRENLFNLFDELWISTNSDGVYDKQFIVAGASDGPGNLNGTISLIEDGPISKRFVFKEDYNTNDVGVYIWITAYKNSGRITLEYTIRNGKSTSPQTKAGALNLKMNPGGNLSTLVYGSDVISGISVSSSNITPQKRGAAQLSGDNGAVSVLINRFSEMYPRSISLDNNGNLNLALTTGQIRPMTAHGVDVHFDFHPQVWSDEALKEWADYYEFPWFALPEHTFIQKTYAWDGMFIGDSRLLFSGIFGWDENYDFTPVSPGYLNYGENRIQAAGNGHGLSDQMTGAFNRFLVTRDMDRFLQAEELAVACMESRGIFMDDVEITLDGTGYTDVEALFGSTDWTDPVEGRMWDSNHRGHYPITEYYYLTGKKRVANAFDNLNKSGKYIYLTDLATRYDQRPSSYYLTHFARNYSITRSNQDKEFLDDYWEFLHNKGHNVEGNNSWDPIHKNGFFASWTPFESDCGFAGDEVKLIFASNWIQSAYDVFFLAGYETAMDHIYAGGKWLMQIYGALNVGEFPGYCYRAWHQTTPSSAAPQDFWNAQDFPSISIFYEFFGDPEVLNTLLNTSNVYWEGGGLGFASVAAYATENQKPDHDPPAKITNIYFNRDSSTGNIRLYWRNVQDAVRLQIKYTDQEGPIKDLHSLNNTDGTAYWEMEHIQNEPLPTAGNQLQSLVLDLPGNIKDYRFAMKSWDEFNNISEISEIGVFDSLATSVVSIEKPNSYQLMQNYPNPFNPVTTIQFSLQEQSEVIIKIFDSRGREIMTLLHEKREAGMHLVAVDASVLTSGVYYYQIQSYSSSKDRFVQTKKFVLLK